MIQTSPRSSSFSFVSPNFALIFFGIPFSDSSPASLRIFSALSATEALSLSSRRCCSDSISSSMASMISSATAFGASVDNLPKSWRIESALLDCSDPAVALWSICLIFSVNCMVLARLRRSSASPLPKENF